MDVGFSDKFYLRFICGNDEIGLCFVWYILLRVKFFINFYFCRCSVLGF